MSDSTALALQEAPRAIQLLRPIAAPAAVIEAQNEAREMVHQALKKGRDYGVIPGTGDKPTMLKPGAERVALAFGCYYGTPELLEQEVEHDREVRWVKRKKVWNNAFHGDKSFTWAEESGTSLGLYRYVVRVPVINRETGEVVGSGVGSCSSMESKYIDRPRDSENTILKMAHKRAMVAACLVTFGLSDEFTQDVEDLPHLADERAPADEATGDAETDAKCPKCKGGMWDNRTTKRNAKAPDYKCKDRNCDGAYWPGQWPPAPAATDEQKAKILTLLETADLNDAAKAKTISVVNATDKPLSAKRACQIIDKLETLAEPEDATQGEQGNLLDDDAPSAPATPTDTKLAPGNVEDALDTRTSAASAPAPSARPVPAASTESLAEVSREVAMLLRDPKLEKEERAAYKKTFDSANTAEAMGKLRDELKVFLKQPF